MGSFPTAPEGRGGRGFEHPESLGRQGVFTLPQVAAFQCKQLQWLQTQLNSNCLLSVLSAVLTCIFYCQSSCKNFLKPILLSRSPAEWFSSCGKREHMLMSPLKPIRNVSLSSGNALLEWFQSSANAGGMGELHMWTSHGWADLFKVY